MTLGIFIGLFVLYLVLGLLFIPGKNMKPFIVWTVLLPLTPALTALHTKSQISVYYAFLILPILFIILMRSDKFKLHRQSVISLLLLSVIILFYLPLGWLFNTNESTWIHTLKDLKPLLSLGLAFLFLEWMKAHQLQWNSIFNKTLLKINLAVTIGFFIVLNKTSFLASVTGDPFYLASQARYLSLGTYFVIFYLLAKLASNQNLSFWELVLVFIPVLLSGNRTILVVLILLVGINMILSMTNPVLFVKRLALVGLGAIALVAGILLGNPALRDRIASILNVNQLIDELMERRFSPFIAELDTFSWYNYLIGKGIGEPFFIPWFTYRENIDDYNIYMDNLYMTLYVKYGLGMFIVLACLFFFVNRTATNKRFKILVISYFLIMGLTTSFMYQFSFLFVLILLGAYTNLPVRKRNI